MAQMITKPGVLAFFEQADLGAVSGELAAIGIAIEEVAVAEKLIGRTVGELESCGAGGFLVVAIRRAGGSLVHNPNQQFQLAEEDRVLLMGHRENFPDIERAFAAKPVRLQYRSSVVYR